MNFQERANLVYRIIQGKMLYEFGGTKYLLIAPNIDILYNAQTYYNELLEEYAFEDFIPQDVCKRILIYNNICNDTDDDKIKLLNEKIDNCKVDIYKSFFNTKQCNIFRKEIEQIEKQIEKIEEAQHCLDYLTLEGMCRVLQQQYVVAHSLYTLDNKPVFLKFADINFSLLQSIYGDLQDYTLTVPILRELARSEPWTQYWRVSKENVFGKSGVYLSSDQCYIILYSQMYDNVHENSDVPSQDIINDDDALDGWFILERRKREQDKKENQAQNMLNIHPGAQEVFIPAQSPQDVERINTLNSTQSRIIKAQREKVIQKLGTATDLQFPDKKLEAAQLAHEAQKGR